MLKNVRQSRIRSTAIEALRKVSLGKSPHFVPKSSYAELYGRARVVAGGPKLQRPVFLGFTAKQKDDTRFRKIAC